MNNTEVFRLLRQRNVIKALVHFSGGNDEGDVESITLLVDAGQIDLEPHYYGDDDSDPDKHLAKLLAEPVWDRYGGFGGDFYVDGRVVYDVTAGTAKMHTTEQESVDHEYELDL